MKPNTSTLRWLARTTAPYRVALRAGVSPPAVRIPMRFMVVLPWVQRWESPAGRRAEAVRVAVEGLHRLGEERTTQDDVRLELVALHRMPPPARVAQRRVGRQRTSGPAFSTWPPARAEPAVRVKPIRQPC